MKNKPEIEKIVKKFEKKHMMYQDRIPYYMYLDAAVHELRVILTQYDHDLRKSLCEEVKKKKDKVSLLSGIVASDLIGGAKQIGFKDGYRQAVNDVLSIIRGKRG